MDVKPGQPDSNAHLLSITKTPHKFLLGFNFLGEMFLPRHSHLTCNLGIPLFLFGLENLKPNLLPKYNCLALKEFIPSFCWHGLLFSVAWFLFTFCFKQSTVFLWGYVFLKTVQVIGNKWKCKLKYLRDVGGGRGYKKDKPRCLKSRNINWGQKHTHIKMKRQ